MRSRYTAYACRDADYVLRTWHPAQRPARLDLTNDRTQWLGLRIVSTQAGGVSDTQGQVEFIARFRHGVRDGQLHENHIHERSRFVREGEAWLYVDGDLSPAAATAPAPSLPVRSQPTVGRNDPCPCGSGQKWKRCCGR